MNKDLVKALQDITQKHPEKILKLVLENNIGIEVVERTFKSEYDESCGNLYFKLKDKYFKIPFVNYSYGEAEYRFVELEEVEPKTKTVTYFE